MNSLRLLLFAQSIYIFLTAVWPIVHINSFMHVTGPKADIWLVKTVGALLIPIAICLFTAALWKWYQKPVLLLGALTSVAFITVDFYYALNDVISDIYLLDGMGEVLFLCWWIYSIKKGHDGH